MLFAGVSSAQKPVKRTSPPKSTVKETKSQFSFVDDPAPIKFVKTLCDTAKYIPRHYYIAAINDSTYNNDSIGFTLQPKSGKRQKLSFENGTKNAFNVFIDKKIKKDSTLYPLILNIREFSITEQRDKPYDKATFAYKYEFLFQGKEKLEKIVSPSGHGGFYSPIGFRKKYDTLVDQTLGKDLSQLDDVMSEIMEKSPILCKGVKINISVGTSFNNANDTIYYNPENELRWEDFTGNSNGADNTFGSYVGLICDAGEVDYANTYYTWPITIGAGFIKSESWIGSDIKDPMLLRHMNYRLKLAQIYAIRLKKRIEQKQFSCENFSTELRNIHSAVFKELHVEMGNYDNETKYGQNKKTELRWQTQITNELLEENK